MFTPTLGLAHGFRTIDDLDAVIARSRLTLESRQNEPALRALSTALLYRFFRTGTLGDFMEAIGIVNSLRRPTFEELGTASLELSPELKPSEQRWVRLQPWLERQGYQLRSRYHPGWIPSWISAPIGTFLTADFFSASSVGIDAIRIEDGAPVWLKLCPVDTPELEISAFFMSAPYRSDPRNHCCPLLDVLHPPLIDGKALWLLVTPLLRETLRPIPETVQELTGLLLDLAEGLSFMHEHNVAHRDICWNNTMMDATHLIPSGWSPFLPSRYFPPDGTRSHRIHVESRSRVPVNYYYIDFGLSFKFPSFAERTLVVGDIAQNIGVPELSKTIPYDPFALDIRMFGDMIRQLQSAFSGLTFLRPVVNRLVSDIPSERASAQEMLDLLRATISSRGKLRLLMPLRPRNMSNILAWLRYPFRLLSVSR